MGLVCQVKYGIQLSGTSGEDGAGLVISLLLDPLPAQDISRDGKHLGVGLPCSHSTAFP